MEIFDDVDRDDDAALEKYLSKRRRCVVCAVDYTEYENLGRRQCVQHKGKIDQKNRVWLCCGASTGKHRTVHDFYRGYVPEENRGCNPCDCRDTHDVFTGDMGHVTFPSSFTELLEPGRFVIKHPKRPLILIQRYDRQLDIATDRAMRRFVRAGVFPARALSPEHPAVLEELDRLRQEMAKRRERAAAAAAERPHLPRTSERAAAAAKRTQTSRPLSME